MIVSDRAALHRQGVIGERHYRARRQYWCDDCGRAIAIGQRYARYYGHLAESRQPFTVRFCLTCDQEYAP